MPLPRRQLLAATAALGLTACPGRFSLLHKIYDLNLSFEEKFLRAVIFWAFCIVPVYAIAIFVDVWIFNLIEFWTGQNPISQTTTEDGTRVTFIREGVDTVRVRREKDGVVLDEIVLERMGEFAATVRDTNGKVLVQAEMRDDAAIAVTSARGYTQVDGAKVRALIAAHPRSQAELARAASTLWNQTVASREARCAASSS